jgi:hypothetical protein
MYENSVRHFANAHYSFWVNCDQTDFPHSTRFRDECLNAELFRNVTEAKIRIEQWRQQCQY